MKTFRISFPRRVRIHGGECGAVARALHHEVQKDALIPYERAFLSQADLKKAFRSTFYERNQMSTNKTLKRIALVAVASLGFGLVSVAPSNAAAAAATPFGVSASLSAPEDSFVASAAVTQVAGALNYVEFTAGADTATSAMRLRSVFVDICFLSKLVDLKDFFRSAWREMAFSSDMSVLEIRSYGMSASFCAA